MFWRYGLSRPEPGCRTVLALDACLDRCSVAVVGDDGVRASLCEDMTRGHVERLAPMVAEAMSEAGLTPGEIEVVATTCGPGGFTGARLGVAFARGFALSTGARAVGISTLEALAQNVPTGSVLALLDARRGEVYGQRFVDGAAEDAPWVCPVAEIAGMAAHFAAYRCVGNGRRFLANDDGAHDPQLDSIAAVRVGLRALSCMSDPHRSTVPHPIYLRAADATPPRRARLQPGAPDDGP